MAWLPYSKVLAPISVWCNWLAWTPVLSIGSALAAGWTITSLFPDDHGIHDWSIQLVDLGALQGVLTLRVYALFLIAALFMFLTFAIQHHGVLRAAPLLMVIDLVLFIRHLDYLLLPMFFGCVYL